MASPGIAGNSRVLVYIVEDDEPVRDSMIAVLESEGFAVRAFGSSEAFLTHFHPDDAACLLLDLGLPGKDGLVLLETLGKRRHHLPVIVITGDVDLRKRARALELGAVAVFLKPLDPALLIATIHDTIRRPENT